MYSQERICPIDDKQAFEDALREIAGSFGEDWLKLGSGHPLQELWKRKDDLSSTELLFLGNSISKIRPANSSSLLKDINIIKKDDGNGRRGAILELILAAALHNPPKQIVKLLDPQNPVYDITVHFRDDDLINISAKNYGQSEKGDMFIREAKLIEQIVKNNLKLHCRVFIRSDIYPSQHEWDMLKRGLLIILKNLSFYHKYNIIDNWHILLSSLILDGRNLYSQKVSYELFITVPFHKNERIRLFSKLNKACSDINQKGMPECKYSANILYIHLPYYVLLDDYYEWCNKYLKENPNSPISSIRLIQPAYASDSEEGVNRLFILYKDITRYS